MRLPRLNKFLVANALLWTLSYIATSARVAMMSEKMPFPLDTALRRVGVHFAGFLLCIGIDWLLSRSTHRPLPLRAALALVLSVLAAMAYAGVNYTAFYVIVPRWGPYSDYMDLVYFVLTMSWTFLVWSAVSYALHFDDQSREKSLRLAAAQTLLAEARNQMLRYQVNPHFLFNTLNALSTLILAKDTARAEQVLLSLSSFLRHSLEKELTDTITLGEEIEAQKQYLSIEQVRFGERLKFIDAVPETVRDAQVPSLILQPLVENAVKHAVAASTGPVTIEIAAEGEAGVLTLSVRDDGPGAGQGETPGLGIGLANIRNRLEAMYGREGALNIGPREPRGFAAVIRLPLAR